MAIQRCIFLITVSLLPQDIHGSSKFLSERTITEKAFRDDIMNAMDSILGCGGKPDESQVAKVRATVQPMWLTMPKTNGRIDRRSLRYIAHRYFMQTSSLMVRGFEPSRPVNDSNWGAADVLSQMVPAYVESVLESQHKSQHGFSLQDVVDMILSLDQLIFNAETSLLEDVYTTQQHRLQGRLNRQGVTKVMKEYIVKWMVDADPEDYEILINNESLAREVLPHYNEIIGFAAGRVRAFDVERQQRMRKGTGKDMLEGLYAFDDAHEIAGGITRSFQSYWQSECEGMKAALVAMDKHSTGRVPLSRFYDTAINDDWRFGESEQYLRELGALDETSKWIGSQVIIPNYIQATSNCIVSSPHYLVCCTNECESLMSEIELAVKAPTALPSTILELVGTMTSQTTLDHDESAHLGKHMVTQLEQVAKSNGGMVPLHGRLFAQWLHYVFPHECSFPHKTGAVTSSTPAEYGDNYIASEEDMKKIASNVTNVELDVNKDDLQWMSQWSPDEELMVDYQTELGSSSSFFLLFLVGGLFLAGAGLWSGVISGGAAKKGSASGMTTSLHSHWV